MERDKRKEVVLQKKAHQDEEKLLKAIQDRNIRVLGSGKIFCIFYFTFLIDNYFGGPINMYNGIFSLVFHIVYVEILKQI